jgi:predicted XRE-type DNA-binding protein
MTNKIHYEKSSGNVFKDLGFSNPELEALKAQLALEVFRVIKQRKLTQMKAASLLGVGQPEISKLRHGKYSRFKVERLFHFLNRLHCNVDIKISTAKGPYAHQRVIGGN